MLYPLSYEGLPAEPTALDDLLRMCLNGLAVRSIGHEKASG